VKIIVTGSSGMVGTVLCEKLLEHKIDFLGIDKRVNRWNKEVGRHTMIRDLTKEFNNSVSVDYEMIVDLAGNASICDLVKKPSLARDNFLMTYNILEFARQNNIHKFIFASSREVYGNSEKALIKEKDVDLELCESSYAATKIAGETLIHAYANCYNIDFVILRFSNIYGRYALGSRVIPVFIKKVLTNKSLEIYGDAKTLDFVYIDDVVDGLLRTINNFGIAKGQAYNIARGKGYSLREVAKLIISLVPLSESKIVIGENRIGEDASFVADINKARTILGYQSKHSFAEGMKKTISWYGDKL